MRSIGRMALVLCVITVLAAPAFAGDWQKLGAKTFVFDSTQATIEVTKAEQACTEIKLKVASKGVRISGMSIVFADGSAQTVDEEFKLLPGDETAAIAINGGAKAIQKIDFTYKPVDGLMTGRARITLVGAA